MSAKLKEPGIGQEGRDLGADADVGFPSGFAAPEGVDIRDMAKVEVARGKTDAICGASELYEAVVPIFGLNTEDWDLDDGLA